MIERQDDNTPWADKLKEVKLPEVADSWSAMEAMLDKTLPMGRRGDGRRWLLLILLLLLLIGVCNCPGNRVFDLKNSALKDPDRNNPDNPDNPDRTDPDRTNPDRNDPGDKKKGEREKEGNATGITKPVKKGRNRKKDQIEKNQIEKGEIERGKVERDKVEKNKAVKGKKVRDTAANGKAKNSRSVRGMTIYGTRPNDKAINNKKVTDTAIAKTAVKQNVIKDKLSVKKNPLEKDLQKKENKAKERTERSAQPNPDKGWAVGIGLNHFFTLGQQQHSDYNSGGTSGGLRDYIPVPMVRYYFTKKLFIQLEAQFNTPQYTRKDLLASQPPADTLSSTQRLQNSVYIKKLFYFNLPLSVHFSPVKNLFLGTGLQFSRLTNGVGLIEDKLLTVGASDSIKQIQVKSLKGDSVYRKIKTGEFRFLADISYQYKNLVIGARYNQALTKFIKVRISDTQVTQARNSSLQLYLRYILWDQRNHR